MFRLLVAVLFVLISPLWLGAQVATEPGAAPSVLVLPFESPGGADQWIGRGVQQDLLTDLSQGTTARVIAPADLPAGYVRDASRARREVERGHRCPPGRDVESEASGSRCRRRRAPAGVGV